jgi:hypothetical protein
MSHRAPVAQACNPSYSGGRDQEDRHLKPAWQIVHETLSHKKKHFTPKRAGGVAQGVGPEFKPQYHQKKETSGFQRGRRGLSAPLICRVCRHSTCPPTSAPAGGTPMQPSPHASSPPNSCRPGWGPSPSQGLTPGWMAPMTSPVTLRH